MQRERAVTLASEHVPALQILEASKPQRRVPIAKTIDSWVDILTYSLRSAVSARWILTWSHWTNFACPFQQRHKIQ
jgi:hypothetical protein